MGRFRTLIASGAAGALFLSLFCASPARTENLWTNGGEDNAWENPQNWEPERVPGSPHAVTVNRAGDQKALLDEAPKGRMRRVRSLRVGSGADGTLDIKENLTISFGVHTRGASAVAGRDEASGVINQMEGDVRVDLGHLHLGMDSSHGVWNLMGGSLDIGRNRFELGTADGSGTGRLSVSGGYLQVRSHQESRVHPGSTFGISGSGAEAVDFRLSRGALRVHRGGVLQFEIDSGGVTPIEVWDEGPVRFEEGALLDLSWVDAPLGGTWDLMRWDGELIDEGLVFAPEVDTGVWSFEFVDTGGNGKKDTLRATARGDAIVVRSWEELAQYASRSGKYIRMAPGLYDREPPRGRAGEHLRTIEFPGNDNMFDLRGVTAKTNHHFHITGSGNTLKGLTVENTGNTASESVMTVAGEGNTVQDVTLHVRGSRPYGYGDLFGKGGGNVIPGIRKNSGMRILGRNTRIIGCEIYMRSFGHGFYVQNPDREDESDFNFNTVFENCYVEGEMRSTDAMLAEGHGPAHDVDFRSVWPNREGEKKITPGYMQPLAEDGFRVYSNVEGLSFINCTARNMRNGWQLRTPGHRLDSCKAVGCEVGFWIESDSNIINSRGDARYGPLLWVQGNNSTADVELMPDESEWTVYSLANIQGDNNEISISPWRGENRTIPLPIKLGYGRPAGGKAMIPYGTRPASGTLLKNRTAMPVIISQQARDCQIHTKGEVIEDRGSGNEIALIKF